MMGQECEEAWTKYHYWMAMHDEHAMVGNTANAEYFGDKATKVKLTYGLNIINGGCLD